MLLFLLLINMNYTPQIEDLVPRYICNTKMTVADDHKLCNWFLPWFINLYREDNLTEEYLKINPTGTIPALVDKLSDVKVWDIHAIGIYLVQKFAPNDSLYPKYFL
jgi:Glutathione S-transferase, N-terminal domain